MISKETSNKNISLLNFKRRHINQTYAWIQNSKLRTMFMMRGEPNAVIHEQYFERVLSDPHQYWYAIYADKKHIGNCGLRWIKKEENIGTIWIYIGEEEFLNKGYGSAATRILIEKALKEYMMAKIILHVAQYNEKAIGMYKKLGFYEVSLDQNETEWKKRECKVIKMQLNKRDFI